MTRRLRVVHVVVQPVLVWDDGVELTPGPTVDAVTVPLSALPGLAGDIAAEVGRVSEADQGALGGDVGDRGAER